MKTTTLKEDEPNVGEIYEFKTFNKATNASGIFNIVNTIIGGGALSLPLVFRDSGIAGGFLLLFIVGLLSVYSQRLITSASDSAFGAPASFARLGAKAFGGTRGEVYTEVLIIFFLIGAQVSYIIIVGQLLTPLIHEIGGTMLPYEAVAAIAAFAIILPLSSLRRMDSLQYTSFIALFFIGCLVVGVLVKSGKKLSQFGAESDQIVWFGTFGGFFTSLPIVNFAFTFHPSIPPVWSELANPSKSNINLICMISVLICSVVYGCLGLFGYLYFYQATPGNILLAFSDDVLFIGLKLGYSLVIIFSYPVLNFATRNGIDILLFKNQPPPQWRCVLEAFIIVSITYGVAMGIPKIDVVFGFVGATFGQFVIFINPALFYILLYQRGDYSVEGGSEVYTRLIPEKPISFKNIFQPNKIPAVILIITGLLCGVVSVVSIIQSLLEPQSGNL